jgi:5'-nucleotidase
MRKILFFLSSLLFATLLLAGCNDQKCDHIYIISTNDIHSTIDAFPRLATLVAEYETKGEVLLVDAGDRVSGNAYVDDATEPGIPIIDLMNTIGYDAATLGNHEFDKGSTSIDRAIEVAEFPIVCANVKGLNGATTPLRYTIIESCGIEIGLVGVVDTDSEGSFR